MLLQGSGDVSTLLYRNTLGVGEKRQKPNHFNDCLFRVLPQHTFSSAKALRKMLKERVLKESQPAASSEVSMGQSSS